ncbi:MAG: hypothetical protein DSY89_11140 [Deltaproteobacteria bacterium]|nr:MAG: hypothetical protein DSY89_11140 [Deltaproteobacteria bacterium]
MGTKKRQSSPNFPDLKRGLQQFQANRLNETYADLRADPQYAALGNFFFNRLYAPEDFSFRDTSMKRLHQALEGKIYRPMTAAMAQVIELHELSEHLDNQMVEKMIESHVGPRLTPDQYQAIYRSLDNDDQRVHQINLTVDATRSFYRLSQKWLVAISLKSVRIASQFLNIGEIMDFIDEGYTAFRKIRKIDYFIDTISRREMNWHRHLRGDSSKKGAGNPHTRIVASTRKPGFY